MADKTYMMGNESMLVFTRSLVSACCPISASVLRGTCPGYPSGLRKMGGQEAELPELTTDRVFSYPSLLGTVRCA